MGVSCGSHGTGEMHTIFWLGNLEERHHFEGLDIDGKIKSECILEK
jgi:hypothetical protein